ncbi:BACON domain-containing protein [Actinacidiphila acididurans]|uniref:BACON domain-containing protein n=1 Tax=Actinacidiphila acididurans TaxID=2784346 RepID=A0ABS2TZ32_9ACTN|nr:BACON domain-containing protein [Actinacidiphila acididurans]MBM9508579.1 BACON domain-containing protein [Actinacidiphila acididurans]
MTSRQQSPTTTGAGRVVSTGAHRRHRAPAGRDRDRERDPDRGQHRDRGGERGRDREPVRRPRGTLPMQPPAHYEPYLDGLFTYCLGVLREHDAAASGLGEVLALAERQRARLRETALRRPWLYALARWVCLRRLAAGPAPSPCRAAPAVAAARQAELAALAWPEAAGTSPGQREALELAVRHQLSAAGVALVLGLEAEPVRTLLARAACEVERTRTALAVAECRACPGIVRFAGAGRAPLGTALRAELVRHVDECEECRCTAERVVAAGPWPGGPGAAGAVLALAEAPRSAVYAAMLDAMEGGAGRSREGTPRFDRRGFPLDLRERAARRAQLRHRAVTTTVVAAVVAAPVLAVWAACRAETAGDAAPSSGGGRTSAPDEVGGLPYEKADSVRPSPPRLGGAPAPSAAPSASPPPGRAATGVSVSPAAPPTDGPGGSAGYLAVTARSRSASVTAVTLTASGAPVHWTATPSAYWLRLSATAGTLRPGESVTITVTADPALAPSGPWTATVTLSPGAATVTLHGFTHPSPTSTPPPSPSPTATASPSATPPPTSPSPTASPSPTST